MGATASMSFNTITAKDLTLDEILKLSASHGVEYIAPWRDLLERTGLNKATQMIADSGIKLSSLCRGGMFTAQDDAGRKLAIEDNLKAIEEAHTIGAETLVLVCGPVIGKDLKGSISMVYDGISATVDQARAAGITLAIEPLHPMMAASRSCITTVRHALDLIEELRAENLKIIVDAYHVWSDPHLEDEGARANGKIAGFHISDWITPINDELGSRAMPGDGCIDLNRLHNWVTACGYQGPVEVEVLSHYWWSQPPEKTFQKAVSSFSELDWR